jgi:hypothetical protein
VKHSRSSAGRCAGYLLCVYLSVFCLSDGLLPAPPSGGPVIMPQSVTLSTTVTLPTKAAVLGANARSKCSAERFVCAP